MSLKVKGIILFLIFTIIILLFSSFIGPTQISLKEINTDRTLKYIYFNIRIPRVLLGFFTGIILSVAGLIFQTLFKNPLVSPFTLGISSSASSGVFLAIKLGLGGFFLGIFSQSQLFATGFSIISIFLVFYISVKRGDMNFNTALLAGISLNFLFSSLILILHFLSTPEESFEYFKWLFGSLETDGYSAVLLLFILSLLLVGVFFILGRELDLIAISEEMAISKGVEVKKIKIFSFIFISTVVAILVSFTGPIAFIGLIVPHMAKAFRVYRHRELVFITLFFGGIIIVISDAIARSLVSPAEIPIGIITTLFGVPFMIYLINSKR